MKEALRTRALELGFDVCRFTTAHPPQSSSHFQRWIQSNQQGEMDYLARNAHKRIDPQQILTGAQSVVCVAMNYGLPPGPKSEVRSSKPTLPASNSNLPSAICNSKYSGVVARYACHEDYHDIMGIRLRELTQFIDEQSGANNRSLWYVDTGPILEREFAQRAGVGFVGKHTNVISRRYGNWILLGEILTPLELEPDPSEKHRCGSCTRCIEACPTNAITAPFQLDARLCISYLTIELKGPIPPELRPAIGNRIFGCDDCLQVCPWNRFAHESRVMKEHRREDLETPDLLELFSLDNAAFKKRFRGTPMERSKRRGLLRNACVVLGNTGGEECLTALDRASKDSEPMIAEHAQWALREITRRTRP